MLPPLPDWPAFSVFLVATLAVGASPGPGMMFAVARSVGQGRLAGAVSVPACRPARSCCAWRVQQWFTASVLCAIAAHLVFAERR